MSRSKNSCGRGRRWLRRYASNLPRGAQELEHGRARARERDALQRGVEMPLRDTPWQRWDLWDWT